MITITTENYNNPNINLPIQMTKPSDQEYLEFENSREVANLYASGDTPRRDVLIPAYIKRDYLYYPMETNKSIMRNYLKKLNRIENLEVINYVNSENPNLNTFYNMLTDSELAYIGW